MKTLVLRQTALLVTNDAPPDPEPAGPSSETIRLVDAARGGNRSAFEELYVRYARMVHGILIARAPRIDVDDLVQDVFLQAMQRLPELRDPAAFGGWLAAIARHRAADHRRRTHLVEPLPDDVASIHSDRVELLTVLHALRHLPAAYRETLVLRLVEGMTGPEIAAATGLTPGSVRVNLHRGMSLLRERLERRSARE